MISIAMATYNGAKYIREQIDSILSQTIQDFELVICDDCSSDGTLTILQEYSNKDERLKLFQNHTNLGFKKNFEKAMGLCRGDYIALCDQDDIWYPNHLEILLKSFSDQYQIVCGDALLIDSSGNMLGESLSHLLGMDKCPENNIDIARHILLGKGSFQGAAMLIRRSLLKYALPIADNCKYHDVWLSSFACFCGGFKYIDNPLLYHRRHEREVTKDMKRQSAFRIFAGAVIFNHSLLDRETLASTILDRIKSLSIDETLFLRKVIKMHSRRKSIFGRLRNIPYLLFHYKSIYTIR